MSTCFNPNLPEYQALKRVYKTNIAVEGVIAEWQKANNSEEFPTPKQAKKFVNDVETKNSLMKGEFRRQLLFNLSQKGFIQRNAQGRFVVKKNRQSFSLQAIRKYLQFNNIPTDAVVFTPKGESIQVSVNDEKLTAKDISRESRGANTPHTLPVVSHLKKMFPGIQISLLDEIKAQELYDSLPSWKKANVPFENVKSFYVDGQAVLIKGRVDNATAIEEVLHPFIDAVYADNKELFDSLLEEARANYPELVEAVEKGYTEEQNFGEKDRDLEIVTKALTLHFQKEFEQSPTQTFLDKIKDLMEWFANVIRDLYKFITSGRALDVSDISSQSSLSDIAKLLNTKDLQFEFKSAPSKRVKYALTPRKQAYIDRLKNEGTQEQSDAIDKLLHIPLTSKDVIDSSGIPSSRVVLIEDTHQYRNIDDLSLEYIGSTTAIGGKAEGIQSQLSLDVGNDFDRIAEGLCLFETFDQIRGDIKILDNQQARTAYDQLSRQMDIFRENGEILIPQVIVSHEGTDGTNIGGAIDILVITRTGKLKIIDLKTSKNKYGLDEAADQYERQYDLKADSMLAAFGVTRLSTKEKHNLQVNLYKRMLENRGFEFDDEHGDSATTFNIWVDVQGSGAEQTWGGNFKLLKSIQHPLNSTSSPYIEALVPRKVIPLTAEQKRELKESAKSRAADEADTEEAAKETRDYFSQGQTEFGGLEMQVYYKAIEKYRASLITRRNVLQTLNKAVFMDESKEEALKRINHNIVLTATALETGAKDTRRIFSQLLRDAKNELEAYEKYLLDEKNAGRPEYIMKAHNFESFKENFRHLHMLEDSTKLNPSQKDLVLAIQGVLTRLGDSQERTSVVGQAIFNHVYAIIKNESNRDLEVYVDKETNEVVDPLKQLMTEAMDMSTLTYLTRDTNTSDDALLAIMKKIWHQKRQEVLDKVQERDDIAILGAKLSKLSPGSSFKDIYSFMVELDENGDHSGFLVTKFGAEYQQLRRDAINLTRNSDGEPMQYREEDTPENRAYNLDLYNRKQEQRKFFAAEKINEDGSFSDGDFHKYTDEWIEIRKKNMTWISNGNRGRWVHNDPKSAEAEAFYAKYFESKIVKVPEIIDGEPTGVLKEYTASFVKNKYVEPRSISSNGQTLTSKKYNEIMNIDESNALAVARRDFYLAYMKYYNEYLDKLPANQRDSFLGSAPRVMANLSSTLRKKSGGFKDLWARTVKSLTAFTTRTNRLTRVNVNEKGEMVRSIPIMYTGSLKNIKAIEKIEKEIADLQKEYANNPVANSKKYNDKLMMLQSQLRNLESRPEAKNLSFNMVESLLMFGGMAENYEIMNAIEDTMKAFEQVVGARLYEENKFGVKKVARSVSGKTDQKVYMPSNEISNTERAVKKFMSMVFYDDEKVSESMLQKGVDQLLNYTSLAYVGFNIFGNFNNYVLGRINNNIETLGQRYYSRAAGIRATKEFNRRALRDLAHRTAYNVNKRRAKGNYDPYKPMSKYEAFVDLFRMMDNKGDLRERLGSDDTLSESYYAKGKKMAYALAYSMQDAAEYNVQTKTGMAIVMDTFILNPDTGEILSLYDAFDMTASQDLKLKEGFTTIIKPKKNIPTFKQALKSSNVRKDESGNMLYDIVGEYDDKFRYNLRMKIREVNKQIHGNYAYEDRMVLQTYAVGKLLTQFKKWVAPAIRARFQNEYFDENLGWMHGRWMSWAQFIWYLGSNARSVWKSEDGAIKSWMKSLGFKDDGSQADDRAMNKALNVHRTNAEFAILGLVMGLQLLLDSVWQDDDEDEVIQKLKNIAKFQASRTKDEMMLFIPIFGTQEALAFFDSPFASTRTLGEFGGVLDAGFDYGKSKVKYAYTDNEEDWFLNKDVFYQRGRRKGELKVQKELMDVIPILYEIKRWNDFIDMDDFYIK